MILWNQLIKTWRQEPLLALAQPGDKIIVVSYTWIDEKDADSWKPRVVLLNDDNSVKQVKA